MGTRARVLILDTSIHPDGIAMLQAKYEVGRLPAHAAEDRILAANEAAVAFLVRSCAVSRRVIEATPGLRIIARHGSGVDSVDVAAATEHGIPVAITGAANATAVSEFTLALMLALCRTLPGADASMRRGEWARDAFVGCELEGRTLGIIGLGNIGARVARHAGGFGMRVLAADPLVADDVARARGAEPVPLATLLAEAEVITLHVRLTGETRHLIDGAAIARMRPGVRIVNTARGEVIDEAALLEGLRSGQVAGAALDTFEREPLPADHPLRALPNVILAPHVAGQTQESLRRMATGAAQAILDELAGRRPEFVYNPEAYAVRAARARRG
jgi:D-3-phosphoglycerate dehydrogenase